MEVWTMIDIKNLLLGLTLVLMASGCQKYKDQIAGQQDEIAKLNIDLSELTDERGVLLGEVDGLETDVAALEEKNRQLEARILTLVNYMRELEEALEKLGGDKDTMAAKYQTTLDEQQKLIDEMKRKQAAAQARLDTLKRLLGKFKSLIAGGKLNVRIRNGKLTLELPSAVLFDSGKAEVSESGLATLGEVAGVLSQIKGREFQVAGHTDNVPMTSGRFKDNWELSTARSVAVVRALQEMGVRPKNLSASGYSEYQRMVANDSKEHKAQNRRIEIILMPNLDELPDMSELEKQIK
jgi:chemotaxis protein MotB